MGLQDSIVQLMLGRGNVLAEQARERVAQQELERQNKHRILNGTLRILATVGPMFIPGGPFASLLGSRWAGLADSPLDKLIRNGGMMPGQFPRGNSGYPNLGTSPGRTPNGLGFTQFFGPMGRDDWYQTPWDEEGVG